MKPIDYELTKFVWTNDYWNTVSASTDENNHNGTAVCDTLAEFKLLENVKIFSVCEIKNFTFLDIRIFEGGQATFRGITLHQGELCFLKTLIFEAGFMDVISPHVCNVTG